MPESDKPDKTVQSGIIKIDKYISEYDAAGPHFYAVKGKERYPISAAFGSMCTDDYLAISKTSSEMGEVLSDELKEVEYWIPRRTAQ